MNRYLDTDSYQVLVVACAAEMPPCRWSGDLDIEGAKRQLGERAGIWPVTILADALLHDHE